MKTGKTLIAIAAAALIPLGAAIAGDKEKSGSMGPSFDTLDANRDGRISQVEASADTTIVFTSADKNGDGYLDKSEWKGKDKAGTTPTPQPQSMPESTETVPSSPPESEPTPDTETPRQ
jgi:EF hand